MNKQQAMKICEQVAVLASANLKLADVAKELDPSEGYEILYALRLNVEAMSRLNKITDHVNQPA